MEYYRGMKCSIRSLSIGIGLVLAFTAPMVMAQTKANEGSAAGNTPLTGQELYRQFCASCHGLDGHGHGPATEALKTPPRDLTLMARESNAKYDARYVKRVIQGEKSVTAHGTSEMPSWGTSFRTMTGKQSEVDARINLLVEYIRTIQR